MNYSSFCEYLIAALKNQLEPDTKITKESIRKNNNVYLDALLIRIPDSASAPVIYLEPLYQNYKNGSSIEKIAHMILARLQKEIPLSQELLMNVRSFDTAKDRIAFRLVSRKNNETLLNDVPWIPFHDLAVTFFIHLGVRDENQITSVIYNHQARSWHLSPQDLFDIAKENTPRIYPSTISRLEHMLFSWDEDEECLKPYDSPIPPLYILTNEAGVNGAACILYEDIIKDFADQIESDLIILPSSIHEVLLLPDSHTREYEEFRQMVRNVNAEEVSKEDILSDELYLYRRGDKRGIILWMPCDSDSAGTCGTESL